MRKASSGEIQWAVSTNRRSALRLEREGVSERRWVSTAAVDPVTLFFLSTMAGLSGRGLCAGRAVQVEGYSLMELYFTFWRISPV